MARLKAVSASRCRLSSYSDAMQSFARLIPFLIVVIIALAVYQIFGAFLAASAGNWPFAAFYAVFGFAGFVLVRALWAHRKGLHKPDA